MSRHRTRVTPLLLALALALTAAACSEETRQDIADRVQSAVDQATSSPTEGGPTGTEAPTEAPPPTEEPTEAPTEAPPTEGPTEAPPTEEPTEAPPPTEEPTEAPPPTEEPAPEPTATEAPPENDEVAAPASPEPTSTPTPTPTETPTEGEVEDEDGGVPWWAWLAALAALGALVAALLIARRRAAAIAVRDRLRDEVLAGTAWLVSTAREQPGRVDAAERARDVRQRQDRLGDALAGLRADADERQLPILDDLGDSSRQLADALVARYDDTAMGRAGADLGITQLTDRVMADRARLADAYGATRGGAPA